MRNMILDKTLPIRLEDKGNVFLGLPTGISGRSFSITKLVSSNKLSGWIVKDGNISEWNPAGMIQQNTNTFVYGNYVEGIPLEAIFDEPRTKQLSYLRELTRTLRLLNEQKIEVAFLATNSVLFQKDGGVCILPPDLMRELLNFYGQNEKCSASIVCNHPDAHGESKLSYFLGSIMYRIVTGVYPFSGASEEDIRYEIRNRIPISPEFKFPSVKADVASFIMKAIGMVSPGVPTLAEWEKASAGWDIEGIEGQVSDDKAQKIILEGKLKEEKRSRKVKRKYFWEKYRVRILATAIAVIAVGAITGITIKNTVFKERVTKGFPPVKIVQTYYNCLNSLDVTTMGDCVTGDAGKDDLNTVMNLYVMSKPMNAYDNSYQYVTADEWDRKGRPPLEQTANMYGIARLVITQEKEEPEPVFRATYERWYSEKDPKAAQWEFSMVLNGTSIEDRAYLKLAKKDWVIYKIERIKEEPIEKK